ncbi:hypothetical protein [Streptomyces phaeolivaceus]|nr:hypothetical protein [Streptomyces phaeolivaceus]
MRGEDITAETDVLDLGTGSDFLALEAAPVSADGSPRSTSRGGRSPPPG